MESDRFSRQSFLGHDSKDIFERTSVGIAGLGGGGSHIAQQLAHLGIGQFTVFDPDIVEESNLNRLVGALERDVGTKTPKVEVASRLILGVAPRAKVVAHKTRWQERADLLKTTNMIFGCVDTFAQRRELEVLCRRYLIPYIDIGMDLHPAGAPDQAPGLAGQVIVSLPGGPCMACIGFLTAEKLGREAAEYGEAGPRPQVIWSNGVLASTAVGLAVDILTGWTKTTPRVAYLSYRGNLGTIVPHVRLDFVSAERCPHYPPGEVGDPRFETL